MLHVQNNYRKMNKEVNPEKNLVSSITSPSLNLTISWGMMLHVGNSKGKLIIP